MGHPLRIVEGNVTERPLGPLGNSAFDTQVYAPQVDLLFDFLGLRKDIHIESNATITVKLGSLSAQPISLDAGAWDFTDEFADKIYVTFTKSTTFTMYANG